MLVMVPSILSSAFQRVMYTGKIASRLAKLEELADSKRSMSFYVNSPRFFQSPYQPLFLRQEIEREKSRYKAEVEKVETCPGGRRGIGRQ